MPVLSGEASFGFDATNSGNEKTPWFSFRAKASAGLFVRIQSAVRLRDGQPEGLRLGARASAAPWRAFAAVTSRAFSRAFCIAPARVRGGSGPAGLWAPAKDGRHEGGRREQDRSGRMGLVIHRILLYNYEVIQVKRRERRLTKETTMTINDALRASPGSSSWPPSPSGTSSTPAFFLFTAFVGANLLQSGFSKTCPMVADPEEGRAEGRADRAESVLLRRGGRVNVAVSFPGGVAVDARMGSHVVRTDQPAPWGEDGAPAPFDLFLASIATCMGFYALRFCQEREIATEGLGLSLETVRDAGEEEARRDPGRPHAPARVPGEVPRRDRPGRRPVRRQEAHGRAARVHADGQLTAVRPSRGAPRRARGGPRA